MIHASSKFNSSSRNKRCHKRKRETGNRVIIFDSAQSATIVKPTRAGRQAATMDLRSKYHDSVATQRRIMAADVLVATIRTVHTAANVTTVVRKQ
jgi:hypothetical protein